MYVNAVETGQMNSFKLANLQLDTPSAWLDITEDLEPDSPFTLAKTDGVGAFQISVATQTGGAPAMIELSSLKKIFMEFVRSQKLIGGFNRLESPNPLLVAESFQMGDQFVRVWYYSNGRDLALATYVSVQGDEKSEIADCDEIVSSFRFS